MIHPFRINQQIIIFHIIEILLSNFLLVNIQSPVKIIVVEVIKQMNPPIIESLNLYIERYRLVLEIILKYRQNFPRKIGRFLKKTFISNS
jgi:hypothetical protein